MKRLQVELKKLAKDVPAGCSGGPIDVDDMFKWRATITGPEGSPYAGGVFYFLMTFPPEYPFKPPVCKFETKIYHCNVNEKGGICLPFQKDGWSPALTVASVLGIVSSFLTDPDPDDALVPEIAELYRTDREEHDRIAREWTIKYAQS